MGFFLKFTCYFLVCIMFIELISHIIYKLSFSSFDAAKKILCFENRCYHCASQCVSICQKGRRLTRQKCYERRRIHVLSKESISCQLQTHNIQRALIVYLPRIMKVLFCTYFCSGQRFNKQKSAIPYPVTLHQPHSHLYIQPCVLSCTSVHTAVASFVCPL